MKLKSLIQDLNYQRLEDFVNCEIKGVSGNSNNIKNGYLFVAIKGRKFDGHYFVNQAINKGAKAVIVENDLAIKAKVTKILVPDSRKALSGVCSTFFGHPTKYLKVIGITGTNGKTTVSYILESILKRAGHPSGVLGTINYRLGDRVYPALNTTPSACVLQPFLQEIIKAQYKYVIIEVSSHALDQNRVDDVDFSSAIFTNLSREHLDYHKNLDSYFSCKSSLFKKLTSQSWAIINVDDAYGRKLTKKVESKLLVYGIEEPAQIRAVNLKAGIEKLEFTAITPRGNIDIESSLIGRHNVYNILAAIGTALIEDINLSDIALGVKSCLSIPGRLERIDCGQDFLVFIDYAHTADALKNILQTLRKVSKSKIILVFGCGGDRDKTKRPRMGKVATELADFVFLTTDNPRSEDPQKIISDIIRGIDKEKKNDYKVVLDRFQAIQQALSFASRNDIVVIAGKGHESVQILADRTIHFSDREAVKKILNTSDK